MISTPAARSASARSSGGVVSLTNQSARPELGHLGEQATPELGGIRQHRDLAGTRHHLAHHRGLAEIAGRVPAVVGHRADADHGQVTADVDLTAAGSRQRHRADGRLGREPDDAAEHVDLAHHRGRQFGRDRQAVGGDGQITVLAQVADQGQRGGPGVDHHGRPVGDQPGRQRADAVLRTRLHPGPYVESAVRARGKAVRLTAPPWVRISTPSPSRWSRSRRMASG